MREYLQGWRYSMDVDGESTASRSLFQYLTTHMLKKFFLISDWSLWCFSSWLWPLGLSLGSSGKNLPLISKLLLAHHILQCRNRPHGLFSSLLVHISSTRSATSPACNPLIWA